jgi:glutamyl-tRNA reductase
VESIRQAEVAASSASGKQYDVVDAVSKNLVRKILHDPTVRLKNSRNPDDISQQASVLSHLFNIDAASSEVKSAHATSKLPLRDSGASA